MQKKMEQSLAQCNSPKINQSQLYLPAPRIYWAFPHLCVWKSSSPCKLHGNTTSQETPHLDPVLVSFPSLWQNTWDDQLDKRKGLFWLMVSDHRLLAWPCCFWPCGKVNQHGRAYGRGKCSFKGGWEVTEKSLNTPFEDKPPAQWPNFLLLDPTS
jgi:hypothetical protein